jgi:hypothetical protein
MSEARWQPAQLTLARLFWFALAVPIVGLMIFSTVRGQPLLEGLDDYGWTPASYALALAQLGVTAASLDIAYAMLAAVVRLGFVGVSLVLFWRAAEWMAFFTSLVLLTFSVTAARVAALPSSWPAAAAFVTFVQAFGQSCLFLFIFIFPTGRFVPRWSRYPTLAAILLLAIVGRMPSIRETTIALSLLWLATAWLLVSALPAQIYRYRRVSTAVQRQQTKLVLFGIAIFLLGVVGTWLLPALAPGAMPTVGSAAGLIYTFGLVVIKVISTLALPLTIGVAILRYRLWDIDVIIQRTLVYSALSAVLAGVYFGSILVLQNVFAAITGETQTPLATVLSTLTIAALFGPVRARVQQAIDRRFYRQKYDAARTLAAFGAQARDVVELEQLSAQLVAAVNNTMQPAHVGLWVRQAAASRGSTSDAQ